MQARLCPNGAIVAADVLYFFPWYSNSPLIGYASVLRVFQHHFERSIPSAQTGPKPSRTTTTPIGILYTTRTFEPAHVHTELKRLPRHRRALAALEKRTEVTEEAGHTREVEAPKTRGFRRISEDFTFKVGK